MRKWFSGFGAALTLTAALSIPFAFASPGLFWGRCDRIPEPNPPTSERDVHEAASAAAELRWMAPAALTEWTYHKTGDNLHPDGNEQQMVWLMNRARANPTQEGVWLATMTDPYVAAARSFFNVDTTVLQNEFAAIPAKPPAAFDVRLYNAAKAHSDYLISIDGQSHDGQLQRVNAAGFEWNSWAGIVYSYSEHTVYGHAGFNIDWGPGTDGTQDPPGHRNAIMSVNADYTNVGYAVVEVATRYPHVGSQVITGNLCNADTGSANHYNRFLVGTVWVDSNGNSQYDPGEGIGGVTVEPDQGDFFAVTANSGGYAIPITAAGDYVVTFSGSMITIPETTTITVAATSVLLDLYYTGDSTVPAANTGSATSVGSGSAVLNGTVSPNGLTTTYYFEYGTTTAYGLVTASWTTDADASVSATVDALSAQTTYHYRLVATNSSGTSYGPDRSFQTASTNPAPSSSGGGGGGGGGGCFLTTAAAGMDPGAMALLAGAIAVSAALLTLLNRRRAWVASSSPAINPPCQSVEKQRLRP
ncbi:MAG TPA: hypothetical protein VFX82_05975 [Desulfobacterales bacterium]|nr:hypothetical protein [Desulfobacterales bacterium]